METNEQRLGASADDPFRVLIVDDDPTQRLLISDALEAPEYRLTIASDGLEALSVLQREEIDVLVTDRRMPGMSGEDLCRRVRADLDLPMLPILMVTGSTTPEDLTSALAAGANDFLRKPYHPVELRARVKSAALRKRHTDQLDSTESTLFALARMVEAKDENTGDHCSRLAHSAVALGRALGLSQAELTALRRGGVLHDIGKLGIPDAILLKPGSLTAEEWVVMRSHTVIGYELVAQLKSMRLTAPIIRHHHERWDGGGYPDGLSGERIPLLARIFQIVDIYDALTFERPYKPSLPADRVRAIFEDEVAQGWRDPRLTREFFRLIDADPAALRRADTEADDLGRLLYERLDTRLAA